jgi:hypothetical protein
VIAWRSGSLPIKRFMLSALGFVLGVVLIVLGAQLAWGLILKAHAAEVSAYAGFETSAAWMSGLLIAASLLIFVVLTIMSRYFGELNVSTAVVLVYLLVSLAFFLFMDSENPLTTAYLAWPFLGGVAGIGVLLFTRNPVWKAGLLALSALVVLALLVPTFMMGRYTREDAWLPVLLLSLQLGAFAPQVSYIFGRVPVNTLTNEREPGSEAD